VQLQPTPLLLKLIPLHSPQPLQLTIIAISDGQITGWTAPASITGASGTATVGTAVVEGSASATTLFAATATPTGSGAAVTYAFTADGNPDSIASATITAGAVKLAGTLDYETKKQYVFKIV